MSLEEKPLQVTTLFDLESLLLSAFNDRIQNKKYVDQGEFLEIKPDSANGAKVFEFSNIRRSF